MGKYYMYINSPVRVWVKARMARTEICLFVFQEKAEIKNNVQYFAMFITNLLSRDPAMLFYCEGQRLKEAKLDILGEVLCETKVVSGFAACKESHRVSAFDSRKTVTSHYPGGNMYEAAEAQQLLWKLRNTSQEHNSQSLSDNHGPWVGLWDLN